MKRYFWLLICLFLGACTTGESTATPVAQAITATPILLATVTATAEPVIAEINATMAVTPTHTPEPTLTPTPIPPPTGRIYFLWDPQPLPISGFGNSVQSLLLATPDEVSTTWNIETVLEGLVGWPAAVLSPDKTQIALSPIEDANQDGFASQEGYNRGFDAPNLYLFDLINAELTAVTTNFPNIRPWEIYWLPEGQTLLLGQNHTISLVSPVDQIKQIGPAFSTRIEWSQLSPNARLIIVNFVSGELLGLDIVTEEELFTLEGIGGRGLKGIWSPDSKWIILHRAPGSEFFFVDGKTFALSSMTIEGSMGLMAWSPINSTLVIHEFTDNYSRLLLVNPKDLTVEPLVEMSTDTTLGYLGWSPDGAHVLYLLKQGLTGSLVTVDMNNGEHQTIWHDEAIGRFNFLGWSPDNEWMILFAGQGSFYGRGDHAGVYMLHRRGNTLHQLVETSEFSDPYGFFWLP